MYKTLQYTPIIKTHLAGEIMKRFILEQSDDEYYTSHSGLALIGLCIKRFSGLQQQVARKMTGQDKISHTDIARNMLGLLCLKFKGTQLIS